MPPRPRNAEPRLPGHREAPAAPTGLEPMLPSARSVGEWLEWLAREGPRFALPDDTGPDTRPRPRPTAGEVRGFAAGLSAMLSHRVRRVRAAASDWLGREAGPGLVRRVLPAVTALFDYRDKEIRTDAKLAVLQLNGPSRIRLARTLTGHRFADVRETAAKLLDSARSEDDAEDPLRTGLIRLLRKCRVGRRGGKRA